MKRNNALRLLVFGLLSISANQLTSCVSPKEVVYLQDVSSNSETILRHQYQTIIQKDDRLSISVSSRQPELTAPFNMNELSAGGNESSSSSTGRGYLVDSQGCIVLPIIGKIHAAGLTCTGLANNISTALKDKGYLNDASVNVQITNFKFSVMGEVNAPGVYTTDSQRLTILEAISHAGDLTIDGNRNIYIIREVNGKRQTAAVDLRSSELFNSPFYYIRQNDVIYVTPSDRRINTRSDAAQWYSWGLSGASLLIAIIALCA